MSKQPPSYLPAPGTRTTVALSHANAYSHWERKVCTILLDCYHHSCDIWLGLKTKILKSSPTLQADPQTCSSATSLPCSASLIPTTTILVGKGESELSGEQHPVKNLACVGMLTCAEMTISACKPLCCIYRTAQGHFIAGGN